MGVILSGLLIAAIIGWFALGPGRKVGENLPPLARKGLGAVLGLLGALLAMRGRPDFGILLISIGGWLLGLRLPAALDPVGRARRSEIRTAMLLIAIDLGDGTVFSRVIAGRFSGQALVDVPDALLPELVSELARKDQPGLALLAPELDRRAPGWREHVQFDADSGRGGGRRGGEMRKEEAYQILGLEADADETAIRAAHRHLISRLHPDRGGSTHLAALVNRAKDVALSASRQR